ncbi:MAG TPA: carboxypeptidase-like regulatory domain-containing protein [Planctomycetota bacterium]|nr:carboxypeptidase-like regulatory domain-containing protein [Planctomycetota bacterium]
MHASASLLPFVFAASLFAQAPTAPLVGTVLGPDGKPVPGASVRVVRCEGRLFRCCDVALRDEWVDVARTKTDKAGRFGLQVPLGLALRVEVDVPPFALWVSESVVPGENQTVQLEAACLLAGQCVNTETGKGTPCALRAWNPKTMVTLFASRTDDEGRFRFERLPSGPFRCDIEPEVATQPMWPEGTLAPGEQCTVEWSCKPGPDLTGTVTDAETGEPIAGARIGLGSRFDKGVRSDVAGRYVMRGFGSEYGMFLHADAPGYAVLFVNINPKAPPGVLDLALQRGVRVVGRVVDADGKPIANAYVAALAAAGSHVPWRACRTTADGEFACDGFPRRTDGLLMVRCAGFASVVYWLPRAAADGQIDFGSVKLRAPQVVRGLVHNGDGSPAAGVEVCLQGVNADADWLGTMPSAWGSLLRLYAGERQVRTDANGAFAFGDVAPGEYTLSLGSMAALAPVAATVTVAAGKELPPITLTR